MYQSCIFLSQRILHQSYIFLFSPGEHADLMKSKELQTAALEKQDILTFERHLAAATSKDTITESNSLLLTQLITRDPSGPPRRPPHQGRG